jgi:hypothetical protein
MKRGRDSDSDSDNDNDNDRGSSSGRGPLDPVFGQHRALPIAQTVLDAVRPGTIPTDAETYLALVRKEAESGSSVMFVERIDYEGQDQGQQQQQHHHHHHHPIENNNTAATISEKIDKTQLDAIITDFNTERSSYPEIGSLPVPGSFTQNPTPANFTEWYKYILHNDASIDLISNFDQELTVKLLIYATKWIKNKSTHGNIAQWIHALLLRLPPLLESQDVAVIRALGLRAKKTWCKGEGDEVTKACCLFVIAVVSRVYGQRDLEDV